MKVAIVGTAPGWDKAPYGDLSWEIWGLNDLYRVFPDDGLSRFTRWWELHGDTPLTRARRAADHFDRIRAMHIPVYYLHGDPPTPTSIKLDTDALARVGRDYFACTNAYQVALALAEGATEIALYGTPLQTNREVVVERPCVAYWLGLAEGRGVIVSVHHENPAGLLRHPYRYAFHDWDERQASFDASNLAFWSLAEWLRREGTALDQQHAQEMVEC